jgi:nicotinamide riboside kinase
MQPKSVYIVGAQCTGKTTLLHALQSAFSRKYPTLQFSSITEVARDILRDYQFSRDDITNDPQRALKLQQLILVAQCNKESESPTDYLLCDRSGVDPIVYAIKYGTPYAQIILESSPEWHYLRDQMKKALVILCQPHREWLVDDGTRLMAKTWEEWESVHLTFMQVLDANEITFHMIPKEVIDLDERVDFVLDLWDSRIREDQSTSV